jgi:predicted transcriptional regulator
VPSIDEISESLEARITVLQKEADSLEDARTALLKQTSRRPAATRRIRTTPKAKTGPLHATASSTAVADEDRGLVAPDIEPGGSDARATAIPRQRRAGDPAPTRKRTPKPKPLAIAALEAMLSDAADGLNATAIAQQANARTDQVRQLLRELEGAGQIRRTGRGRATRWTRITDEERVAARAAELEKVAARKS